jgi:hypothetical protein
MQAVETRSAASGGCELFSYAPLHVVRHGHLFCGEVALLGQYFLAFYATGILWADTNGPAESPVKDLPLRPYAAPV